jgi:hypothetical protein
VLARVLSRLEADLDDLAVAATDAIFAENPTYAARGEDALRRDVQAHVREHLGAALQSMRERAPVTREDLLFIRRYASKRVTELSVADFIHAFHVGQRVLWQATLALATDDPSRRAVLGVVPFIVSYFDVATTHAAEVYVEAEKLLGATGERVRRDALEELLAGAVPAPGPRLDALRDAGLEPGERCVVVAVAPVTDTARLREAAGSVARAARRAQPPLTVIRRDEIVVIAPAGDAGVAGFVERVRVAQGRLAAHGVQVAIGVSTVQELENTAEAYREAVLARTLLGAEGGITALPAMSVLDYMTLHSGPSARRMLSAKVAEFVADDAAHGGALVATLRAYVAAGMNVKQAAEELHVHVNTAQYRLHKIAERTGTDLRRGNDVIELLIASKLAAPAD